MKKIKTILIITLMFQIQFLAAQEVKVNWSENQNKTEEVKGTLMYYIDANNERIFALFDNINQTKKLENMKIVAFDKTTMKNKAEIDFIEIVGDKKLCSDYQLIKVVIQKDAAYVFLNKVVKEIEELYVAKLDNNLKKVIELKKILSQTIPSDLKRISYITNRTSFEVLYNKNEIVIGYEKRKLNELLTFHYGDFDLQEGLINEKVIELPVITNKKYIGLSLQYKLLEDGNILFKYDLPDKETKNPGILRNSEWQPMLSFLNTKSNKYTSFEIDFRDIGNRNLSLDLNFISNENNLKVFGFYFDTTINRNSSPIKGESYPIKGVSYIEINKNTLEKSEIKTIYFNNKNFDDLNQNLSSLDIEKVYEKNNNIYVVITQNYRDILPGDASAIYYLKKGNIFVMNINEKGENSWVSKIEREKFFNSLFYIPDIKSFMLNDKIVIYYMTKPIIKKINLNPKHEDFQNNLNYSIVDIRTSQVENKEIYLDGNKDSDDKMIHIQYSTLIDNIFYTYPKIQSLTNNYSFGAVILK